MHGYTRIICMALLTFISTISSVASYEDDCNALRKTIKEMATVFQWKDMDMSYTVSKITERYVDGTKAVTSPIEYYDNIVIAEGRQVEVFIQWTDNANKEIRMIFGVSTFPNTLWIPKNQKKEYIPINHFSDEEVIGAVFDKSVYADAQLVQLAINAENAYLRDLALRKLKDQALLAKVALESKYNDVSKSAALLLTDQALLAKVASEGTDEYILSVAIRKLTDQTMLAKIATGGKDATVRAAAALVLTDRDLLMAVAKSDPSIAVRQLANLHIQELREITDEANASTAAITPGHMKGEVRINMKDGAEMVWVPAGEFLMGSSAKDKSAAGNEIPQRKVYVDGYWIYKTEVTVAQYFRYCYATRRPLPEEPPWGWLPTHPITNVDRFDASAYANWAGVGLPSEAQWEKAARGGDGRVYPWGNAWDATRAHWSNPLEGSAAKTASVGSYPAGASPYGVLDMAGNVQEWCGDWYKEDYYRTAPLRNPTGPRYGEVGVLRGGNWQDNKPGLFRAAVRRNYGGACGFRCAY
jgi:sulfatase modifying factor 1